MGRNNNRNGDGNRNGNENATKGRTETLPRRSTMKTNNIDEYSVRYLLELLIIFY